MIDYDKIQCPCDFCGKPIFGKRAYWILIHKNSGEAKNGYCSESCRLKGWSKDKRSEITCAFCGKKFFKLKSIIHRSKSVKFFCSRECSGKSTIKLGLKRDRVCKICGKVRKNTTSVEECSACKNRAKYNAFIAAWKSGKISGNGAAPHFSVSNYVREYLFKKFDSKCCQCGWGEINPCTKKSPLNVEHIDGNYKNTVEKNLKLLCPNCHSLTSTYGSLNRGYGRENRHKNAGVV